jgi:urea carboxylase
VQRVPAVDGADGDREVSPAALPAKVLVANRGEIACRVLHTLRRLGVASVAVFADADAGARHVRMADEAVAIGPAPVAESYLRGDVILAVARDRGVDVVHPGYGLLSENAQFAAACEHAGIGFAGPTPAQIRDFGLKHRARELAARAGVPICPGSDLVRTPAAAVRAAAALGYPVLLKATAGGGGIGLHRCADAEELRRDFARVQRLAEVHFGNAETFVEKLVPAARHVEVQVFGDGHGDLVTLGARDCSLQRRRQKVVEEAPAPGLDPGLARELRAAAAELARAVAYRSAGTVELLVDRAARTFYFLEVNTRLQVEHGVTEAIANVDLVEWMIRLAAGDPTPMQAYVHAPRGHAIEVRLYAEDPGRDFQPCAGVVTEVCFPADVRVDGWIEPGTEVSPFYDPLLAKVIAWGETRADALARLAAALAATRVGGVQTNLAYLRAVTDWATFREDTHDTESLAALPFRPTAIEVLAPGDLTTVQAYPGRLGYWHVGVPPSGPMDGLAFRLGNRIVGNRDGAAGLEITVRGPRLRFHRDALVCLTGAPAVATIEEQALPMWEPVPVPAGATLAVGAITGPGARSYLLVRGGLDVPRYLGSEATFTLGGFGGHCGRALVGGDALPLGDADDAATVPDAPLPASRARGLAPVYGARWELRVLDGPHASPEFFTPADIARFYDASFEVHYQSARTGVRLIGPRPVWSRTDGGEAGLHPSNIHDTAYGVGAVDYTGDMPVILGPDGPSLGGFVCPAVVIHADRWKLGQLRPGDHVRFRAVTLDEAETLDRRDARMIATRRPPDEPAAVAPHAVAGPRTAAVLAHRGPCEGTPEVTYRQSGDRYLLVEYGPMVLDLDLRIRVQLLLEAVTRRRDQGELAGIVDLTPGIRSLQVHYDPYRLPRATLLETLHEIEAGLPAGEALALPSRVVHLPLSWDDPHARRAVQTYTDVVRTDAPWCPSNIEFIRRINGLASRDEVRRIVFEARYLVLGLGDVYLGAPVATPLDPRHRLVTTKYNPARTWTPENAVGIGGAYLCVYGMEGPGGYQLVGRTVPVWSTYERWRGGNAGRPWLLRFFDQIRFFPVEADELLEYRREVREGRRELTIEEGRLDVAEYRRFLASIAAETDVFRRTQRAAFAAERARWQAAGEFAEEGPAAPPGVAAAFEVPDGAVLVTAPLGAQVLRVGVSAGARVTAGDELAVLSAMKMETLVPAPYAGTVERVLCRAGQVVASGAPLMVLREG